MKMMKKIAILGFGREGRSVLRFIKKTPAFRGAEIWILDKEKNMNVPPGAHAVLGPKYLAHLEKFNLVFRSPGIPYTLPQLVSARRHGAKFSSLIELFFAHCPATVIGITGTKGKGTTATLLYKMLKAAGRDAHLAGNVGVPALEILPKLSRKSLVVLELSSFQLQDLKCSPPLAVVLDVFPDHQDAHENLKEYYEAKANIARFQAARDKVFSFKYDRLSAWVARHGHGKKIGVDERQFALFGPEELAMPGYHNFKNAVMAATVARALGVPARTIIKTARRFSGNEHRLEFVKKIGSVAFYNDSASTNPQTSSAALLAFPDHPKALIVGGQDKNLDYAPLAKALAHSRASTKLVVLFGENKNKIRKAIAGAGVSVVSVATLRAAIGAAFRAVRPSGIVLFSPGATSFDRFKNYADRGEQFKRALKTLK